jgi:hypothetical protein
LFRFAVPLRFHKPLWNPEGAELDEPYRLLPLALLDQQRTIADVRMAWSDEGLAFSLHMTGKIQQPWCREARLDESDGIQLWIDTRATHDIHRASRFCHRFAFLPAGGGQNGTLPIADQLVIHRARENARPVRPQQLKVRSHINPRGYALHGMLPAETLTGFDPGEHPRIGFNYAVFDRELGLQTFSAGSEFPYEEDPSTWATLELIKP